MILIALIAAVSFSRGFAETSREELMARMGFSKEEIAKDAAANRSTAGTLAGKSDPKKAALVLREANEINKLRDLSAIRQRTESLIAEAEKSAALAAAKAEAAVRATRRMIFDDSISGPAFSQALDARDQLVAAAETQARELEQARIVAAPIIAKARAAEAKLEEERLARVVAIRDKPAK